MRFVDLARKFEALEKTNSRNLMTEMVAEGLREAERTEVAKVVYLMLGQLGPAYERVDFQLAEKMVVRVLAAMAKVRETEVWREYKKKGDLGLVAEELRQRMDEVGIKEKTVEEQYERLEAIAKDSGLGSQERKVRGLVVELSQTTAIEAKYLVRIVLGRLRLGFSDKTILDAIAVAAGGSKSGREALEQAYQVSPDIGWLAEWVKGHGLGGVEKEARVKLFVPVMPALCQRLKTAEEMIKKMGRVVVEPKYDGTRVQIHLKKLQVTGYKEQEKKKVSDKKMDCLVKTYTRNLEETTAMFPELKWIGDYIQAEEVILDSEAVGVDPMTGKLLPFQMTITRKRKHEVEAAQRTVPVIFFVFDVLYVDGRELIREPLVKRRERLKQLIKSGKEMRLAEAIVTDKAAELRAYHLEQLSRGLEGVVVKQINSGYDPGRRGFTWVKFKELETQQGKLADSIDAVVMGFYRGRGKRAKFGIGAFLVGVKGNGNILTVAKIGTGLTDEQWRELRRRLELRVRVEKPAAYRVDKSLIADVWVDPEVVVEVVADEITKSPVHAAGWALRFPRLKTFRDDKGVEGITTVTELERIRASS